MLSRGFLCVFFSLGVPVQLGVRIIARALAACPNNVDGTMRFFLLAPSASEIQNADGGGGVAQHLFLFLWVLSSDDFRFGGTGSLVLTDLREGRGLIGVLETGTGGLRFEICFLVPVLTS